MEAFSAQIIKKKKTDKYIFLKGKKLELEKYFGLLNKSFFKDQIDHEKYAKKRWWNQRDC